MSRIAKSFFIPVAHSPPGAVGHVAAPEIPSQEGRAPSRGTRDSTRAPLSGRQSPESWDMWQHRSSPRQGGKVRSWGKRGSVGAHLSKEARSSAPEHVVALEPTSAGRCGLKLQFTWQCVDARPASYLLRAYMRGTRSSGYRQIYHCWCRIFCDSVGRRGTANKTDTLSVGLLPQAG
jgi:hypothetical protein